VTTTKDNFTKIHQIAKRANAMNQSYDLLTCSLDIEACLDIIDLDKLLAFNDLNFSHDVFGIARHLNRVTKELMDCFSPRCSK